MFSSKKTKEAAAKKAALAGASTTTMDVETSDAALATTDTDISEMNRPRLSNASQVNNDVIRAAARASIEASEIARTATQLIMETKTNKREANTEQVSATKTPAQQTQSEKESAKSKGVPPARRGSIMAELKSKVKLTKNKASADATNKVAKKEAVAENTARVLDNQPQPLRDDFRRRSTSRTNAELPPAAAKPQSTTPQALSPVASVTSGASVAPSRAVLSVTSTEDFDKRIAQEKTKKIVAQFSADWCTPCKKIAPRLQELAASYKEEAIFFKLNVDNVDELVLRYSISSLPTFLVLNKGVVVNQMVGGDEKALVNFLTKSLVEDVDDRQSSASSDLKKRTSVAEAEDSKRVSTLNSNAPKPEPKLASPPRSSLVSARETTPEKRVSVAEDSKRKSTLNSNAPKPKPKLASPRRNSVVSARETTTETKQPTGAARNRRSSVASKTDDESKGSKLAASKKNSSKSDDESETKK